MRRLATILGRAILRRALQWKKPLMQWPRDLALTTGPRPLCLRCLGVFAKQRATVFAHSPAPTWKLMPLWLPPSLKFALRP